MHARQVRAGDRIVLSLLAKKDPRSDGRKPLFLISGTLERKGATVEQFSYRFNGTFD